MVRLMITSASKRLCLTIEYAMEAGKRITKKGRMFQMAGTFNRWDPNMITTGGKKPTVIPKRIIRARLRAVMVEALYME